jgi:hypothetical protein
MELVSYRALAHPVAKRGLGLRQRIAQRRSVVGPFSNQYLDWLVYGVYKVPVLQFGCAKAPYQTCFLL